MPSPQTSKQTLPELLREKPMLQEEQAMELFVKLQAAHSATEEQSISQISEEEFQEERLWQDVQEVLSAQSRQF